MNLPTVENTPTNAVSDAAGRMASYYPDNAWLKFNVTPAELETNLALRTASWAYLHFARDYYRIGHGLTFES